MRWRFYFSLAKQQHRLINHWADLFLRAGVSHRSPTPASVCVWTPRQPPPVRRVANPRRWLTRHQPPPVRRLATPASAADACPPAHTHPPPWRDPARAHPDYYHCPAKKKDFICVLKAIHVCLVLHYHALRLAQRTCLAQSEVHPKAIVHDLTSTV